MQKKRLPTKNKKKGIVRAIQNKAPKKQTPIMGNTGSMGMMGY